MKRIFFIFSIIILSSLSALAQKTEVLYFKAQLGCCMARACDQLQNDIKTMLTENFKNGEVIFTEVKLNDPANAELVKKYNARSQTVVIVKKAATETHQDISQDVRSYQRSNNKEEFEKKLLASINEKQK